MFLIFKLEKTRRTKHEYKEYDSVLVR